MAPVPIFYGIPAEQAALAQLVEHSIRNRKVVSSNLMGGSIQIHFNKHSNPGFSVFLLFDDAEDKIIDCEQTAADGAGTVRDV